MRYERDIDKIYDNMNNEKKGQLIDAINNALTKYYGGKPLSLSDDVIDDDSKTKMFLSEYVRTDDEVLEGMLDYLEITCDTRFLDTVAIIDADNDYMHLIDDLHLNVYELSVDYDDLIDDGMLIEL